jgi:hypothetical protein
MKRLISGTIFAAISVGAFGGASPSLTVSGGITLNGVIEPLLFTWNTSLTVAGAGWNPGEAVVILLHGPLNSPGVSPRRLRGRLLTPGSRHPRSVLETADITLGTFTADSRGNLSATPTIPYDRGIVGPAARIPRPGYYEVLAAGAASGTAAAADRINLCPSTYTGSGSAPIDWGHDRGGRDGVFPGDLRQFSPERFDPEWPTAWDALPVEIYGTIAPTDENGSNQPSQISPSDNPPTHYGHDATFFLVPDEPYRWVVGTVNYFEEGEPDVPGTGRIELEWETLNGGSTSKYGQPPIGLPIWANPTVGDRVYVLGRWILDAGHPEIGDRTEIHPPRLIATMRRRPAQALSGAAAAQVDIYVSGHGGGANHMPPGLTAVLDQRGHGGGRIRDVLGSDQQDVYYRPGPLLPALAPLVEQFIQQLTGQSIKLTTFGDAGPTAFPWGQPGTEERPINDMDYDFDVPLPPGPSGAADVVVDVTTQPQHTTSVTEQISYSNGANGLPAVAHVHLPYRGADNGIYARTLKFSWAGAAPPPNHFVVRLNRINVKASAGTWQLWADVSGNWIYLSGLAPALLNTTSGQSVTLPDNHTDVFLRSGDTLRVYVQGYKAACLDGTLGQLFGQSSYMAGFNFLLQCGPTNNQDLGGAVLDLPVVPPTSYTPTISATDSSGASNFSVDLSIDSIR